MNGEFTAFDQLHQEPVMGFLSGVTRGVAGVLNATTAAAGAISGAAIGGAVGGARGTADGLRSGLSSGSHSTPAAALTLAVFGVVGLVEWPVLLVVGGAALAVRQLTQSPGETTVDTALRSVPAPSTASAPTRTSAEIKPVKASPKTTKTAPSATKTAPSATKPAPRKAAARTTRSRPRT